MEAAVFVVGASNVDCISYVDRLPVCGETLLGTQFRTGFGGKGANQAVMAAKLGAPVHMLTKVGRDAFGRDTIENFRDCHVALEHVLETSEVHTGVAPIAVLPNGENSIIVVAGANNLITKTEVEACRGVIRTCRVAVGQLEIPLLITQRTLEIAREEGVMTILNPAPATSLPDDLYHVVDILCPNESETEILTGMPVTTMDEVEKAGRDLLRRGVHTVIITLGARGCLLLEEGKESIHVPAQKVNAIDTTGAGDCFIGSLAVFLARGLSLRECVRRANCISAYSVQGHGTQTSFPAASKLPADLLH